VAPTGLTAVPTTTTDPTQAGYSEVNLSWTPSPGATAYNIYQGTSPGGESAKPVGVNFNGTSYTVPYVSYGTTYYYKVVAVNSFGASGSSNEANATPVSGGPATLLSAASSQVQGTAGTFNLPLALTGTPTIECRRGSTVGSYSIVMTFSQPVTSLTATLGLQAGQTGTVVGSAQTPSISGSTVTVNLTGVADAQCLNLQLTNIQPGSGTASVPLNILWGNVKGTGVVSSADYLVTRSEEGALLNSTNCQYDVNCDGIISSGDALLVRSLSGTFLP
jgi:hypothetical protein